MSGQPDFRVLGVVFPEPGPDERAQAVIDRAHAELRSSAWLRACVESITSAIEQSDHLATRRAMELERETLIAEHVARYGGL